jgi:hypothetical protein
MCKLLLIEKHSPASRDALILKTWAYFAASGEKDGFGAMWISKSGKLAFAKSSHPDLTSNVPVFVEGFNENCETDEPSNGGWLMIHGRRATCDINTENTHPMITNALTAGLVHNGVVDSDLYTCTNSTCDSELLLHAMTSHGIDGLRDITGYFAFGMLQKAKNGWVARIARDDQARLRVGSLKGAYAFGTTDEALAICGAKVIGDFKKNTVLTYNANGTTKLEPLVKGYKVYSKFAQKELDEKWLKASEFSYGKSTKGYLSSND